MSAVQGCNVRGGAVLLCDIPAVTDTPTPGGTLCKGNAIMYRARLGMQARASGRAYQTGLPVPVPTVE